MAINLSNPDGQMEWDEVQPIVKIVPWARASISVTKDEKVRLHISLSELLLKECGTPKAANVQVGVKDGVAMVRMVWADDGKFPLKELDLGGARVRDIPVKPPIPDGAREVEACVMQKKDK